MAHCVIEGRLGRSQAAISYGVSARIVARWVARHKADGGAGMVDRSSRPHRLHGATPQATINRYVALRRQRWTGKRVARDVGVSPATVSSILKRAGLRRLKDIEPARCYERRRPGEMIHIDIKKPGKFSRIGHRITGDRHRQSSHRGNGTEPGWEFVHVAIDDHSRLSFNQFHPDEKAVSAIAHLRAAIA